ncbi:Gfo/Idh/MocA family oxidoreductase [Flagellimonas halotolerans]|uniref:Gfo/Idh/MocA family oxidoreductase n=1 Tax=Flagellimonas halotolerans TaxID=3112164 RepID=A0ABU6INE0_9FLAO|nr:MULTISPECIES: Gfo/Idh/MocA family oxidoreductase [unclassified Allomuricauda]MEC3964722.1 Gfo/Idh/MocA family oxidoreductase [Muricauda sp. SYSU M86414]MEC4264591.1 Gfo/Idh/MocA family oxidoreductase [Muricauda sp. SYSU M84420]
METKIRWGIVGPGKIARKFVSDLMLVDDAEIAAVASRSLERAEAFANDYNVQHTFGSYDALFRSGTVDVVYIATPHNFHKELSVKALENGIGVLCEKPMGVNRAEVVEQVNASKQNNAFLMEAMWSRFNPSIKKVKQLVDEGVVGDLKYIHADFAFYGLDRDLDSRLLNPDLASGSILDIGIYPIFLSYLLLGMPDDIMATSKFHENGTELQTSMIFDYKEAQSILYSGLTSDSKMEAEISGSKGQLFLKPRWHEADEYTLAKDDKTNKFSLPLTGIGYYYEILEVHKCLCENKIESDLWSHQNSLDLSELLDKVREKSGVSFPFET